ncbi:PREDICTED: protein trachealess-like, partial [Rhagoletis zephyria]|uniref:protein trachealess-like n=1 Tax=Rhagoletis zephyria TaxID=28612 RepID=UPI00081172AF
ILEMRKEKSRDAARSRRGKENHEFYELAKMLPLPAAITSQLDKASIIRLTISYLKLREFSQLGDPSWSNALSSLNALKCKANTNVFESHQGTHILQSLDGFAFALGQDGRFLYISETVSIYLGLSQVEMTGSSIFDYTHQQDHAELAEQLGLSSQVGSSGSGHHPHHPPQAHSSHSSHSHHSHHHHHSTSSPLPPGSVSSSASNESDSTSHHHQYGNGVGTICVSGAGDTLERQFCMRMKSTLTKRGCQHFKSSGYRSSSATSTSSSSAASASANTKIIGLVAIAIALPPPSINELRLEPDMFVTRHSLDFKIIHCEQRVTDLLNYSPDELVGRSIYSLIHGQDVVLLKKCHLDLIHKGQAMSGYYRVVNKTGGYTSSNSPASAANVNGAAKAAAAAAAAGTSNAGGRATPVSCSGGGASTPIPGNATPNSVAGGNGGSSGGGSGAHDDQDQSVICVNYVLSAIEYTNVIMDACQLGSGKLAMLSHAAGPLSSCTTSNSSSSNSNSSSSVSTNRASSPGKAAHGLSARSAALQLKKQQQQQQQQQSHHSSSTPSPERKLQLNSSPSHQHSSANNNNNSRSPRIVQQQCHSPLDHRLGPEQQQGNPNSNGSGHLKRRRLNSSP